jgi:hypothetical protein
VPIALGAGVQDSPNATREAKVDIIPVSKQWHLFLFGFMAEATGRAVFICAVLLVLALVAAAVWP